jgi:hypothetical protein
MPSSTYAGSQLPSWTPEQNTVAPVRHESQLSPPSARRTLCPNVRTQLDTVTPLSGRHAACPASALGRTPNAPRHIGQACPAAGAAFCADARVPTTRFARSDRGGRVAPQRVARARQANPVRGFRTAGSPGVPLWTSAGEVIGRADSPVIDWSVFRASSRPSRTSGARIGRPCSPRRAPVRGFCARRPRGAPPCAP